MLYKYFIELHNVPNEIALYMAELESYGKITRYSEKMPTYVWIESLWEKDILEQSLGVKSVHPKRYDSIPISMDTGRNWTELIGTKYDDTL